MEFIVAVLVAGALIAIGFTAGQWLSRRFQSNADEARLKAYRDAYTEAQRKIAETALKEKESRERYKEFPQTGQEDIQTYEESLKNFGQTPEQIEKALEQRRKM